MSEYGTFKCAMCGGTFDREWSDDVANVEAERLFGVKDACSQPDMDAVCDDCFNKLNAQYGFMEGQD